MSEEVLIVVRAEDQASGPLNRAASASQRAGAQAGRAGQEAARGASGWVTAGNATGKAGDKARDAAGRFQKAGAAAAASGAAAARSAVGVNGLAASLDRAQRKAVTFGKAYRDALDERTTTRMDVAGLALVGAFGAATWAAAGFDQQMSAVSAVTGASATQMDRLREAALKAGADTAFTARDAALAETELAKAGVSTSDVLGGALSGSLSLAAAGGVELGRAAEIAASAMNTFGLAGRDVGMVADTLASGANKSAAGVDDLAQALSMGGTVASMMGMNVQDTVGMLSMFADAGIKGSDAGTMLKTTLMRLTPQSDEAAAAMDELGFSAYDSQGRFVGMASIAGQLQDKLGKLSVEEQNAYLTTMFGADAYRAAAIMMEQGAGKVDEYTAAMHDQGAASRMAAEMMNNLAGDVEQLKGSLETTLIKGGTGANGVLRSMAQAATTTVNAAGALPAPLLGIGFAVTGLVGGFTLLAPRILATKVAFATLKKEAGGLKPMLGNALKGVGIGVGLTVLTAAAASALETKAKVDGATKSLEDFRAALANPVQGETVLSSAISDLKAQSDDLKASMDATAAGGPSGMWNALTTGLAGIFKNGNALSAADEMAASQSALANQTHQYDMMLIRLAGDLGITQQQAADLADKYVMQGKSLDLNTLSYGEAAKAVADFGRNSLVGSSSVATYTEQTNAAADATQSLAMQLSAASGWLSQRQAVRAYKAAIDDAAASVKKNGKTLNDNTEKGRANAQALDEIAIAAARAYTKKTDDGTIIVTDEVGFAQASKAYERAARKAGKSAGEAKRLANKAFGEIVAQGADGVISEADAAKGKVDGVKSSLDQLQGMTVDTYIRVHQVGQIPGIPAPTTDPAGDTASPKATGGSLARTLARHSTISAGMTGMRITNLLTGGGGHGRGSGDHQAGRAIDVQGPRLGDYVRRVREAGGFAELHGTGAGRHAHAVMGDTASPRGGNTAGGDVNVSVPVQVIGRLNADEIEGLQQAITSAVGPAVSRWTQQRRERGK